MKADLENGTKVFGGKQMRKCAKLAYKISQLPERKETYED